MRNHWEAGICRGVLQWKGGVMNLALGKFQIALTKITHGVGLFLVIGRYEFHIEAFKDKPRYIPPKSPMIIGGRYA